MEKIYFVLLIFLVGLILSNAQVEEKAITLETTTGNIQGTLLLPLTPENPPVVLIISGSGPTDRDGNNPIMKNNSLKMLAEGLAEHGIASLRYDKRGIGETIGCLSKTTGLECCWGT